jgi:hypothetical protein
MGDIWEQRAMASAGVRRAAERERAIAVLPAVPGRIYLGRGCADTVAQFPSRTGLDAPSAQRFREQFAGRWVRWAGMVTNTNSTGDGRVLVQFRCSTQSLLYDGHVWLSPSPYLPTNSLDRNQIVAFEAVLVSHDGPLGLTLQNGTLIP